MFFLRESLVRSTKNHLSKKGSEGIPITKSIYTILKHALMYNCTRNPVWLGMHCGNFCMGSDAKSVP